MNPFIVTNQVSSPCPTSPKCGDLPPVQEFRVLLYSLLCHQHLSSLSTGLHHAAFFHTAAAQYRSKNRFRKQLSPVSRQLNVWGEAAYVRSPAFLAGSRNTVTNANTHYLRLAFSSDVTIHVFVFLRSSLLINRVAIDETSCNRV